MSYYPETDFTPVYVLAFIICGVSLGGLLYYDSKPKATTPTCEKITIIESKTEECVLLPIPGSRKMDGIPDEKKYCITK